MLGVDDTKLVKVCLFSNNVTYHEQKKVAETTLLFPNFLQSFEIYILESFSCLVGKKTTQRIKMFHSKPQFLEICKKLFEKNTECLLF